MLAEGGVALLVCPFEIEAGFAFLVDAVVGVMKLALELISGREGVLFGVCVGVAAFRRFLLTALEVMSARVPIVQASKGGFPSKTEATASDAQDRGSNATAML